MKRYLLQFLSIPLFLAMCKISLATPWFTGPILAGAGHTIPKGHTNWEFYDFNTFIPGVYDSSGHVMRTLDNRSFAGDAVFSHGITDKIDIQLILDYNFNHNAGAHSNRLGDTKVALGYQLVEQKNSRFRPDIRLVLGETIPTGRYDLLNPAKNGTDATGFGSDQTSFYVNFQHLAHFSDIHYLRTRLSLGYIYAREVPIEGFSVYGGNAATKGSANLGNSLSADLAAEFSVTQNWVAVMEAYANSRKATNFKGSPGINVEGNFDIIGNGVGKQLSLAPAMEYNFSPNIGIISGIWFTVYGRETAKFITYVVALNAYW